jgi:hypothetical protein
MRVHESRERTPATEPEPPSHPTAPPASPRDPELEALVAALPASDEATRLFAQNAVRAANTASDASAAAPAPTTPPAPPPPRANDRILYLGMNSVKDQNDREARGLGIPMRGHAGNVTGAGGHVAVGHAERDVTLGADKFRVGARVVDLATPEGASDFVSSLRLPPEQSKAVAKVLTDATPGSRDELAGIAVEWAKAERGGDAPSRLVLSGHSGDGRSLYGDGHGDSRLSLDSVRALAQAMPRAASFVEDVMLSACNSGFDGKNGGTGLETWKAVFPNLRTAWGYGGRSGDADSHKSPSEQQAVMHVMAWERATRGRTAALDAEKAVRSFFDDARKQNPKVNAPQVPENVSVWTVRQGYVQGRG